VGLRLGVLLSIVILLRLVGGWELPVDSRFLDFDRNDKT
jgi:hypothetical protein